MPSKSESASKAPKGEAKQRVPRQSRKQHPQSARSDSQCSRECPHEHQNGSANEMILEQLRNQIEQLQKTHAEEIEQLQKKLEASEARFAKPDTGSEILRKAFSFSHSCGSSTGSASQFTKGTKANIRKDGGDGCLVCSSKRKFPVVATTTSQQSSTVADNGKGQTPSTSEPTLLARSSTPSNGVCSMNPPATSVAHIIPNKKCADYLQQYNLLTRTPSPGTLVHERRNGILLCGSHGEKGTCHDKFDSYKVGFFKRGKTGSIACDSCTTTTTTTTRKDLCSSSSENEWIMFEIGSQKDSTVGGKKTLTVATVDFKKSRPRRNVMHARSAFVLMRAGLTEDDLTREVQRHTASEVTHDRIVAWLNDVSPEISPGTTGTSKNGLPLAEDTPHCSEPNESDSKEG